MLAAGGAEALARAALEVQRLKREVRRLQTLVQERAHFEHIITGNAKMLQVLLYLVRLLL